jgi:hypothetical protein
MALRTLSSLLTAGIISSTMLADDAVTADKVADGAIDNTAKIGSGVIVAADLDLTGTYNFTGTLQKDGTAIAAGDLYFDTVDAVTANNIANLSGGAPSVVDGVTLSIGSKVLVKTQTSAPTNGIYVVDTVGTGSDGTWSRVASRDAAAELPAGLKVYIKTGGEAQKTFKLTVAAATVGTNDMTFEEDQEGLSPSAASGGEPEVMGTGDGSNLNFDFDAASPVAVLVTVDGIVQAPGTWSVSGTGGSGGVAQLQFGSGNAPANGAVVEATALYRS